MSSKEYERIKKNLTVVMLSKDCADMYGMSIPHVPMGDMTLAYQLEQGDGSKHLISYPDLVDYNITADQLHRDALESAERLHPAVVQSLEETLGLPPGMSRGVPTMYVVTNATGEEGAAAISYPGMMQRLAEKVGGDFVILPSSIHEMMVVQTKGADLEKLASLLRRVNREQVAPQERLSDTIYCYDSKAMMVMRASVYEKLMAREALHESSQKYAPDRSSVLKDLRSREPAKEADRPALPKAARRMKGKEESL